MYLLYFLQPLTDAVHFIPSLFKNDFTVCKTKYNKRVSKHIESLPLQGYLFDPVWDPLP